MFQRSRISPPITPRAELLGIVSRPRDMAPYAPLLTLILLLAFGNQASAASPVPWRLLGGWSGSVDQPKAKPYSVEMWVAPESHEKLTGMIRYPELSCSGRLEEIARTESTITFQESLSENKGCVNGGKISISRPVDHKAELNWKWYYSNNQLGAQGKLSPGVSDSMRDSMVKFMGDSRSREQNARVRIDQTQQPDHKVAQITSRVAAAEEDHRIHALDGLFFVSNWGVVRVAENSRSGNYIYYTGYVVESTNDQARRGDRVSDGVFNIGTQRTKFRTRGYPATPGCDIIWTPSSVADALWSDSYVPVESSTDGPNPRVWKNSGMGGQSGQVCEFPMVSKSRCHIVGCGKWADARATQPDEVNLIVRGLDLATKIYSNLEKFSSDEERSALNAEYRRGTLSVVESQRRFREQWQQSIDDFVKDQW